LEWDVAGEVCSGWSGVGAGDVKVIHGEDADAFAIKEGGQRQGNRIWNFR